MEGKQPRAVYKQVGKFRRLESLLKRLIKDSDFFQQYNQKSVEKRNHQRSLYEGEPTGKEFYLTQKPVIRQSVESTKLRIVFDASAGENDRNPSLNDVIEV